MALIDHKLPQRHSRWQQPLFRKIYDEPGAHDRKTYDVERDQAAVGALHRHGMGGNERNAEPSDNRLLDRLVAAHLHADARCHPRVGKQALHEESPTRTAFAYEKGLGRKDPRCKLPLLGMDMV